MYNIVSVLKEFGRRRIMFTSHRVGVEQTARVAPEWGVIEVRRSLDKTNEGPFMGWPSQ